MRWHALTIFLILIILLLAFNVYQGFRHLSIPEETPWTMQQHLDGKRIISKKGRMQDKPKALVLPPKQRTAEAMDQQSNHTDRPPSVHTLPPMDPHNMVHRDETTVARIHNAARGNTHTNTSSDLSHSPDSCLKLNSHAWLTAVRRGNVVTPVMHNETWMRRTILESVSVLSMPGRARHILGQTLAHSRSQFMNDNATGTKQRDAELWRIRLMYLAMHYHQHAPAIPEAMLRLSKISQCQADFRKYNVSAYDYECPGAKFLIVGLSGNGIGVNVRAGAAMCLLLGIRTERVVIFVNNSPGGWEFIQKPLPLGSCDRRDIQCFFLPQTPCVLTQDEVTNALQLKNWAKIAWGAEVPPELWHERVLFVNMRFAPMRMIPHNVKANLSEIATHLMEHVPADDPRLPAMRMGRDLIQRRDPKEQDYASATFSVAHALTFFVLRPHPENLQRINAHVDEMLRGVDTSRTFGIPVRASDKCDWESDCISFNEYMRGVNMTWSSDTGRSPVVIFTTESRDMMKQYRAFLNNTELQRMHPYNYSFVINDKDVLPDTGTYERGRGGIGTRYTADENMLSALTSIKLQMAARKTMANCCSNFHTLIGDFLTEGLGIAPDNNFTCLNNMDDPALKICCGWHKDCVNQRRMDRGNGTMGKRRWIPTAKKKNTAQTNEETT